MINPILEFIEDRLEHYNKLDKGSPIRSKVGNFYLALGDAYDRFGKDKVRFAFGDMPTQEEMEKRVEEYNPISPQAVSFDSENGVLKYDTGDEVQLAKPMTIKDVARHKDVVKMQEKVGYLINENNKLTAKVSVLENHIRSLVSHLSVQTTLMQTGYLSFLKKEVM